MQKWTPSIRGQLNNLPGFPARPNTVPPADDRWELGEWIDECHVRPEVADFASLPLTDNQLGDVRVVLADQAWYVWDGAAWQSMGGGGGGAVNNVTASAPISSSGGANPNISLTGVVDVPHGGTGQSTLAANAVLLGNGASAVQTVSPGASGNVLTSNGTTWQSTTLPAAPVTSVGGAGGSTGLTLTGGPTGAVTLTLGGTLAVTNGGTGVSTVPANGALPIGNGTGYVVTTLTAGSGISITNSAGGITIASTSGGGSVTSVDVSGGTTGLTFSGGPVTGAGTITMTGTLALTNGGTGQTTASAAFGALSPLTTKGDILTFDVGNQRLGVGTNGQVLTADSGTATGLKWATPAAAGTVTSVGFSTGLTGFTVNGASSATITTSGTFNLGGALVANYGGTGFTNYTVGDILYANTVSTLAKLPAVAIGSVLISNGVATQPTWSKVNLANSVSGTLGVSNGGTGAATLADRSILVGNGTAAIEAPTNFTFDSSTNTMLLTTGAANANITLDGVVSTLPKISVGHSLGSNSATFVDFSITGAVSGGIRQAAGGGTPLVYATTSDYRLKTDVQPIEDPLARLASLKPCRFHFTTNPTGPLVEGFIAHEVQEVVPQSVAGAKDAVDAEGKPEYQGFDQGHLVPLLTAAMQKLMQEVEALKAEVAALRGTA